MKRSEGFTLIEVMGAMVIFTGGILMVLNLAETLSTQLQRSALITQLSAEVRNQVDSLEAEGFAGLSVGTTTGSRTLQGRTFNLTRTVTDYSPLVKQVTVKLEPSGFVAPSEQYSTWVVSSW